MMFDGNGDMQSGQQHVMELKMENAREVHPIVRALMFREVCLFNHQRNECIRDVDLSGT